MQTWSLAAEAVATVLLILVCAKAHGRQVRLERERHGVWKVDFRRRNDPWVEGLWRRDRIVFWSFMPLFLLAGAVIAMVTGWVRTPVWFAFVAAWAFAACFITAGLASSARLIVAMRQGVPSEEWRKAGHRGSLLWWSLVAVAGPACAAIALVP